jgi:hypothetical protein
MPDNGMVERFNGLQLPTSGRGCVLSFRFGKALEGHESSVIPV